MFRHKILVILLVAVNVIAFEKNNYADELRQQAIIDVLNALDQPMKYYGKVIDNNNQPVPNAQVYAQVSQAAGVNDMTFITDTQGKFSVVDVNGSSLLIDNIVAQGYEYSDSNREDGHSGFENDGSTSIDQSNPVVFAMRKKEPPTVVIPGDFAVVYKKNVNLYELDLIKCEYDKPFDLQRYHGKNAFADIKTRVEYSVVDDSYTFTLETSDTDGVIALDQILYALPEIGYTTPFKIRVLNNQNSSTYLYVKSRGGKLYSRLEAKFKVQKDEVVFSARVMTNPLGERNVDFDSDKYKEYIVNTAAGAERMWPITQ